MKTTITTKLGQASHMGKHEPAVQLVRLVRELLQRMEDDGTVTSEDHVMADNIIYTFLAGLPAKVSEELRHG